MIIRNPFRGIMVSLGFVPKDGEGYGVFLIFPTKMSYTKEWRWLEFVEKKYAGRWTYETYRGIY